MPVLSDNIRTGKVRDGRYWKKRVGLKMTDSFQRRVWRALIAEYIATTLFVFVATASVVCQQDGNVALVPTLSANLMAGLTQGLCIAALVYTIAKTSGGHINPVVSFALSIAGGMPWIHMLGYIVVQLVGGITGAALLAAVMPGQLEGSLGTTLVNSRISYAQAFLFEAIVTFILVFTVLGTGMDSESDNMIRCLAPIPVGFSVAVGVTIAYGFTGGSLNPARTFGPAVISHTWEGNWVYWAGPFTGALIAAIIVRFIIQTKPMNDDNSRTKEFINREKYEARQQKHLEQRSRRLEAENASGDDEDDEDGSEEASAHSHSEHDIEEGKAGNPAM